MLTRKKGEKEKEEERRRESVEQDSPFTYIRNKETRVFPTYIDLIIRLTYLIYRRVLNI